MPKALLLFSGGLDSSTLLGKLRNEGVEVTTLSFNYEQRHSDSEMTSVRKVLGYYGIDRDTSAHIDIFLPAWHWSESVLIDKEGVMPHDTYEQLQSQVGPSPTYVPFRNGVFLAHAVAVALMRGIETVAIATHASDWANWAYPDCSPEFIGSMGSASFIGTYFKTRILAPFIAMTKGEIVKLGTELKVPYKLTWSCYEGGSKPCRKCPTCIEREAAFASNGMIDPLLEK